MTATAARVSASVCLLSEPSQGHSDLINTAQSQWRYGKVSDNPPGLASVPTVGCAKDRLASETGTRLSGRYHGRLWLCVKKELQLTRGQLDGFSFVLKLTGSGT